MSSLYGNTYFSGVRSHSNNVALQLPTILTCNELSVINNSMLHSLQVNGTATVDMPTTLRSTLTLTDSIILDTPVIGNTLTSNYTVTICTFNIANLANDGSSKTTFTVFNSLITAISTVLVNISNYTPTSGAYTGIPYIYTNVSTGRVGIVLQNINPVSESTLAGNITFSIIVLGI